jgi:hypothetical protein
VEERGRLTSHDSVIDVHRRWVDIHGVEQTLDYPANALDSLQFLPRSTETFFLLVGSSRLSWKLTEDTTAGSASSVFV